MNKSTFFSGQPIFTQLLKFVSKDTVVRIAQQHNADRYSKRFNTYEHLVTLLYSIFNNCNSLREVATGMLASEQRLSHIGIRYHPRRSTISDANNRRQADVFGEIYYSLYSRYASFLSDSRKKCKDSKLYIFDATTISLFHEVLRTSGKNPSGKRKGGIKVHTLIRSDQDVPCMIRYSAAAANDSQFLKEIFLPKGSVLVFDRGYCDYTTLNRFANDNITWVTRLRKQLTYKFLQDCKKTDNDPTVISDEQIQLGWRSGTKVTARLVRYKDIASGEQYEFISNNFKMKATTIAGLYQKRWQIELLFKRMKQNYPLKYFLGDSENAI
ncbi:MAG TPA: IS4 family transposase [Chitinophagaceae bacterium]|nr:IS4 family transposase [Chitinophagaceae bacterium]